MANDSGKTVLKVPPCKVPDPCLGYDDYDPCQSNEDITEKDLAVLLKEEQAKLQREKERAEAEMSKQEAEGTGESSDDRDTEGKELVRDGADGGGRAEGKKPCHRKKRLCRKISTNPFFTNRLQFSTDLPPPPPFPPPQFLPLMEESDSKVKVCRKRRKKCKKKKEIKKADDDDDDDDNDDEDDGGDDDHHSTVERREEEEVICDCMNEDMEGGMDTGKKGKRRCKKPERFPCRKKVSEVSISLQPRHIPALQRDLPPTCPKDIPEVVRQILMACGKDCEIDCSKKKSKKKCEKVR